MTSPIQVYHRANIVEAERMGHAIQKAVEAGFVLRHFSHCSVNAVKLKLQDSRAEKRLQHCSK